MLSEMIKNQATIFGTQIRDFEDLGLANLWQETRILYVKFLASLPSKQHRIEARRYYWIAYSRNPIY